MNNKGLYILSRQNLLNEYNEEAIDLCEHCTFGKYNGEVKKKKGQRIRS